MIEKESFSVKYQHYINIEDYRGFLQSPFFMNTHIYTQKVPEEQLYIQVQSEPKKEKNYNGAE